MKKSVLLFSLVFCFGMQVFSQSDWTWDAIETEVSNDLNNVCFINVNHGWVIGEDGLILATSDGGDFWEEQASNVDANLKHVQFVDISHGWILGDVDTGAVPFLRTIDGGDTWDLVTTDEETTAKFIDFHFVNALVGYAMSNNQIWRTEDGGESWSEEFFAEWIDEVELNDILAVDEELAYVCGREGFNNQTMEAKIMQRYSIDDYTYWEYTSGDEFDNSDNLNTMAFNQGQAFCGGAAGIVYRLEDGVWTINFDTDFNYPIRSMSFADGNHGIICIDYEEDGDLFTSLFYTHDGGDNWYADDVINGFRGYDMQTINAGTAWIVGTNGGMYKGSATPTHMREFTKIDIDVYPNPTNGDLNVQIQNGSAERIDIVVLNTAGQEVFAKPQRFNQSLSRAVTSIDVSDLKPGVYLVQVKLDGVLAKTNRVMVR